MPISRATGSAGIRRIRKNTIRASANSWTSATSSRRAMKRQVTRRRLRRLRSGAPLLLRQAEVEEPDRVVRMPGDAGQLVGERPLGLGLDDRDPGQIVLQDLLDLGRHAGALAGVRLDQRLGVE